MSVLDTTAKETVVTYEFSTEQIRELIAYDLSVDLNRVHVEYVLGSPNDYYDRGNNTEVQKVKVTIKKRSEEDNWGR